MNTCYDLFSNWQTEIKTSFEAIRSLFSFSTAQTEKNLRGKLGKTRFGVQCFDPMSSLKYECSFLWIGKIQKTNTKYENNIVIF